MKGDEREGSVVLLETVSVGIEGEEERHRNQNENKAGINDNVSERLRFEIVQNLLYTVSISDLAINKNQLTTWTHSASSGLLFVVVSCFFNIVWECRQVSFPVFTQRAIVSRF
jgi:hypothetical protein